MILHVLRKINTCLQLPYAYARDDSRVKLEPRFFLDFCDLSGNK